VCKFCDTDFAGTDGTGGGKFADAETLARAVAKEGPGGGKPYVVCTGGEPLLQLDSALVEALHDRDALVGVLEALRGELVDASARSPHAIAGCSTAASVATLEGAARRVDALRGRVRA
jgi:hypothetical protein